MIDLDGIFNNLISNSGDAFKRSDAGDRQRDKTCFFNLWMQNGINVVYEDSGPGLEEEIIDPNQIFSTFLRQNVMKELGEDWKQVWECGLLKTTIDEYNGDIQFINIRIRI